MEGNKILNKKRLRHEENHKLNKVNKYFIENRNPSLHKEKKKSKEKNVIKSEYDNADFETNMYAQLNCNECKSNINNEIKFLIMESPKHKEIVNNENSIEEKVYVICFNCLLKKINQIDSISESLNIEYKILPKIDEKILTSDWTYTDEIKLMAGMEKYGLANWEEISKIVGKGIYECEAHYYSHYYNKKNAYKPIFTNEEKEKEENKRKTEIYINSLKTKNEYISTASVPIDLKKIRASNNIKSNRTYQLNRKKEIKFNINNNQTAKEALVYWVRRKEFDIEHKNDAELQLSEQEYKYSDSKYIKENKIAMLKDYNNILSQRKRRDEFVIEKDLFDIKKILVEEKKSSKIEREVTQEVKKYLKYLEDVEYQRLLNKFLLKNRIIERQNGLKYYKQKNCKTIDDINKDIKDEANKKKQNLLDKEKKKNKLREGKIQNNEIISALTEEELKFLKDSKIERNLYIEIKTKIINLMNKEKIKADKAVEILKIREYYNLNSKSINKLLKIIKYN